MPVVLCSADVAASRASAKLIVACAVALREEPCLVVSPQPANEFEKSHRVCFFILRLNNSSESRAVRLWRMLPLVLPIGRFLARVYSDRNAIASRQRRAKVPVRKNPVSQIQRCAQRWGYFREMDCLLTSRAVVSTCCARQGKLTGRLLPSLSTMPSLCKSDRRVAAQPKRHNPLGTYLRKAVYTSAVGENCRFLRTLRCHLCFCATLLRKSLQDFAAALVWLAVFLPCDRTLR